MFFLQIISCLMWHGVMMYLTVMLLLTIIADVMTLDLANNNVACSPHTFLCKYQIKTFSDIKLYLFSSQYLTEVSLQIIFNISFGPHSTLPSTGFILLCEISNIWKITFYTPCYNDVVE